MPENNGLYYILKASALPMIVAATLTVAAQDSHSTAYSQDKQNTSVTVEPKTVKEGYDKLVQYLSAIPINKIETKAGSYPNMSVIARSIEDSLKNYNKTGLVSDKDVKNEAQFRTEVSEVIKRLEKYRNISQELETEGDNLDLNSKGNKMSMLFELKERIEQHLEILYASIKKDKP